MMRKKNHKERKVFIKPLVNKTTWLLTTVLIFARMTGVAKEESMTMSAAKRVIRVRDPKV